MGSLLGKVEYKRCDNGPFGDAQSRSPSGGGLLLAGRARLPG